MTARSFSLAAALLGAACNSSDKPAAEATQPSTAEPSPAHATDSPTGLPPGHPPVPSEGQPAPAHGEAKGAEPSSTAGGMTWDAKAPFEPREPSSTMRAAEYAVSGPDGEAELAVFYFGPGKGGGVEANLERWIGQFEQPDGRDSEKVAKRDTRQVGPIQVTTLDLAGTFQGGMGMGRKQQSAQSNYRVLGAIAEGKKGRVFFKLVGPASTVEKARDAFAALVDSLEPVQRG